MFSGLDGPRTFSVCVDWSQLEGDSFTLFSSFVASSGLEFKGSINEIVNLYRSGQKKFKLKVEPADSHNLNYYNQRSIDQN